jgi:hypothetical protein
VGNLVTDIKGRTSTEGFSEPGSEENIWIKEKLNDGKLEKTA